MTYQEFEQKMDKENYFAHKRARCESNKAYNKGLFKAVWWRNPAAYFVLRRPECDD